jgi:hypothetical protein
MHRAFVLGTGSLMNLLLKIPLAVVHQVPAKEVPQPKLEAMMLKSEAQSQIVPDIRYGEHGSRERHPLSQDLPLVMPGGIQGDGLWGGWSVKGLTPKC